MGTLQKALLLCWGWCCFAASIHAQVVNRAEYFFGQDPGVGNGTPITISSPGEIPSFSLGIGITGLGSGIHDVFIRLRDSNGRWGFAEQRSFWISQSNNTIQPTVVAAEYFFDTDPGMGNGTNLGVDGNGNATGLIGLSGLEAGVHQFFIRYRDSRGHWGIAEQRLFWINQGTINIQPSIVAAEYFFNQDPGVGSGTNLPVGVNGNIAELIGTGGLELGPQMLFVRYKDSRGNWGIAEQRLFFVKNQQPDGILLVTAAEYFIDGPDPGPGNGISINVDAVENLNIERLLPASGLAVGPHKLHLRIKDSNNRWSIVEVRDFEVFDADDPNPPVPDVENLPNVEGICAVTFEDLVIPTATDEISGSIQGTTDQSIFPITVQGVTMITWSFQDEAGNIATQTQQIVLSDVVFPTIVAPEDILASVNPQSCSDNVFNLGNAVVNDNCGIASVVNNAPASFAAGITEVTWWVTDLAGNVSWDVQIGNVVDDIAPTITAPDDISLDTFTEGCDIAEVDLGIPSYTDNCGVQSIENDAPEVFPPGETVVTWTVTDIFGNTATDQQVVTVVDNQLPTIQAPADIQTANDLDRCDATIANLGTPIAGDNCGIESITNDAPEAFPVGQTVVTWTVTDNNGNTATDTQIVTVVDNQLPTIQVIPVINVNTDPGSCDADGVNLGVPVTADNCGIAIVESDTPAVFPLGQTIVTWIITDIHGNSASAVQTVTVSDKELPTIAAPADVVLSTNPGACFATGVGLGTPVVDDNCTNRNVTNDAPASYPIGETLVTWTVTDVGGNTQTAIQRITVNDTQAPVIVAPGNITVQVDLGSDEASSVDLGQASVSDNCSVGTATNDAPGSFPVGSTTVTWSVTDASGNTATATQTVTVLPEDSELPTIVPPANVFVNTDPGSCLATDVALGTPTVTGDIPAGGITNNAPSQFTLGTTVVTWRVEDVEGNVVEATQSVTVQDAEDPVIFPIQDVQAETGSDDCVATNVSLGIPEHSDNCSIASISNNAPAEFPLGLTEVTWTVIDGSGNQATAIQKVEVLDTTQPILQAPSPMVIDTDNGSCDASGADLGTASASDNCSLASLTNDAPAIFPLGETIVTWTATDGSGNTATATQSVTVEDNEDPTVTAPGNINIQIGAGEDSASGVDIGEAMTSDNCSVQSVTNDAPSVFPLGLTTVTWTVVDGSGNTASAQQTVNVTRDDLPTITAPSDITVNAGDGLCSTTLPTLGDPVVGGNVPEDGISNDAPSSFPVGTTIVTWTATDANGNVASAEQKVNVIDNQPPSITAPANITVNEDDGNGNDSPIDLGNAVAGDNCGIASVTNDAPLQFPIGMTVVTWTATDIHGNTATDIQTVTVNQEVPVCTIQVITKPEIKVVLNKNGKGTLTIGMVDDGSSSNCGAVQMSLSKCDFTCDDIGDNIVKFTVKDVKGTKSSVNVVVKVVDETKPKVSVSPAPLVKIISKGSSYVMPDLRHRVTASDNCSYELSQCP